MSGESCLRAREAGFHDLWASRVKPSVHMALGNAKGTGDMGTQAWSSEAFETRKSYLELREKLWTRLGGLVQWFLPSCYAGKQGAW